MVAAICTSVVFVENNVLKKFGKRNSKLCGNPEDGSGHILRPGNLLCSDHVHTRCKTGRLALLWKHVASGSAGLGFNSQAGHIGHSAAKGSPLLRCFFGDGSCRSSHASA